MNGMASESPQAKLRYDIEYTRKQSFWVNLKIVIGQLYSACVDVVFVVRNRVLASDR